MERVGRSMQVPAVFVPEVFVPEVFGPEVLGPEVLVEGAVAKARDHDFTFGRAETMPRTDDYAPREQNSS